MYKIIFGESAEGGEGLSSRLSLNRPSRPYRKNGEEDSETEVVIEKDKAASASQHLLYKSTNECLGVEIGYVVHSLADTDKLYRYAELAPYGESYSPFGGAV